MTVPGNNWAFTNATGIEFPVLLDVTIVLPLNTERFQPQFLLTKAGFESHVGALTYGQIQTRFERYLANQ